MTPPVRPRRMAPGRPVATSHEEIEQAAFELFAERGFDGTTLEAIAQAVGVGRRTLFHYFDSKNDIPWGQFGASLVEFRAILLGMPREVPTWLAVHRAILSFNDFADDALPLHRQRMRLILRTPTLEAHSVHQYAAWRAVIAEFVATRHHVRPDALLPRTVGHVSLAVSISAYEQWLDDEDADLAELLDDAMGGLRTYFAEA